MKNFLEDLEKIYKATPEELKGMRENLNKRNCIIESETAMVQSGIFDTIPTKSINPGNIRKIIDGGKKK